MIISQMLSPINKYLAFTFSISLQPSTPLTTPSYSIVFLLGSAFLNYASNGLPLTYYLSHQLFPSHLISFLLNISLAEFYKAPFWALSFLICTPLLSVLSLVSLPSHTSLMQMILDSSSLSFPQNFPISISDLESIISLISSWMSTNYLTLNPSKTEFLPQ